MRLTTIHRGVASTRDVYTISVGFTAARADAEALAQRLEAAGFPARVMRVGRRAADDPQRGPLGYVVRSGSFATEEEAMAERERVRAYGADVIGARAFRDRLEHPDSAASD